MFLMAGGNAVALRNHHRRESEKVLSDGSGGTHPQCHSGACQRHEPGIQRDRDFLLFWIPGENSQPRYTLELGQRLNWASGPAAYKKEFGLVGVTAQRGR
jgi:hypothetical protein